MSSERFPLIIQSADGTVIACTFTNRKAVAKSIERDELWFVHPETDRVLPWKGGAVAFSSLVQPTGAAGETIDAYVASLTTTEDTSVEESKPVERGETIEGDVDDEAIGDVFAHLIRTIAERRQAMPEGSYTTHLFSKGAEKIRKKTGEEAVELILARDSDEMASEAADLIYHLLVLFEAEGESFLRVIEKLRGRF